MKAFRVLWLFLCLTAGILTNGWGGNESPFVDTDDVLAAKWKELRAADSDAVNRRHVHGLMRAAHKYADVNGSLPPAVVPNAKLPGGKRLSGLVLLLPYLDADSWNAKGEKCFDEATIRLGKELSASIDLTKGWDDPANIKAAKTLVPAFLSPTSGKFRDERGFAVSHFAFVQGSDVSPDGAFPGDRGIRINEITDGTVNTLAIGQIATDLGPWIAEGLSTARQVYLPTPDRTGTFGSRDPQRAWFANCDSFSRQIDFMQIDLKTIQAMSTRAGGEIAMKN